jgi:polysaccharide deacetylase 2 family uncharacterized protein YibQ
MFSKKIFNPQPAPQAPPPHVAMMARAALANPYVGAGGAAGLLLITAIALIGLMGDPKAGAPVVRLSLARTAEHAEPPGWREALAPDPVDGPRVLERMFQLSATPLPGADVMGGHAIITLSNDAGGSSAGAGLPTAPIAGLFTPSPGGPLPIISADGRTPFDAYKRPFTGDGRPKVALVIGGLGLNAKATRQAIEILPPEVTLSFVPYAEGLQGWIDLARTYGHEVLLEAPMEPVDYPENDPGPYTLMATAPVPETARKLEWVLSRATGYFGVTNYLGSRFLASDAAVAGFTGALRSRGLAFLDDGQAPRKGSGVPRASADKIIDEQLSEEAINQRLNALEVTAGQQGQALGSGFAYPLTLTQAARWAEAVETRGFQLAPASALTVRR